MTGRRVDFDDAQSSVLGVPHAEVLLKGPGGPKGTRFRFANVLVDTGATHAQLPEEVCTNIGISIPTGTIRIQTANGRTERRVARVDIEVQGVPANAIVVYIGPGAMPLLGRSALYALYRTTGFTKDHWLWDLDGKTAASSWSLTPIEKAIQRAEDLMSGNPWRG